MSKMSILKESKELKLISLNLKTSKLESKRNDYMSTVKILKNLCSLFVFIALVSLVFSYTHFKTNKVTHFSSIQVESYLESITEEPKLLSQFLDFEWDELYIIGPYNSNKQKHKLVGSIWYTNSSYIGYILDKHIFYDGEILSDAFHELVFTHNNKVVSTALLERRKGDFLNLENHVYNNSNAKFIIEIDEYFYRRIIHSKSI